MITISFYEHIGDIVACEPIVPYLKNKYPQSYVIWITDKTYTELLTAHPAIDEVVGIQTYTDWVIVNEFLKPFSFLRKYLFDLNFDNKRCIVYGRKINRHIKRPDLLDGFGRTNLVNNFTKNAGIFGVDGAANFYVDYSKNIFKISGKYFVFHTSSNNEKKNWIPERWQNLARFLLNKGFIVAEIGTSKNIDISSSQYYDFTGTQSLQAIANLIDNAFFFIGLDSGFAHIASALNIKGFILMAENSYGMDSYKNFNPFTGLYKSNGHILYSSSGSLASLSVEEVISFLSIYLDKVSLQDTKS